MALYPKFVRRPVVRNLGIALLFFIAAYAVSVSIPLNIGVSTFLVLGLTLAGIYVVSLDSYILFKGTCIFILCTFTKMLLGWLTLANNTTTIEYYGRQLVLVPGIFLYGLSLYPAIGIIMVAILLIFIKE